MPDRQGTHGQFGENAEVAQRLKEALRAAPGWQHLPDAMKEALEADAVKNARILCGDPCFRDHWEDKIGYCERVLEQIEGPPSKAEQTAAAFKLAGCIGGGWE